MRSEEEIRKEIDNYLYVVKSKCREDTRAFAAIKADLLEWVLGKG